ncbi:hypothetical protein FB45DRAFT_859290 [Roridomyces roridus]|uniref:Uncharacterized protein n=1 Tax=Roridomyces roridus TaxID=1738132 RepID=A0AAD7CJI6_9AGAR|nr:hypothetical protein FB45DRAFT_859290 [Roridomyces roridus]
MPAKNMKRRAGTPVSVNVCHGIDRRHVYMPRKTSKKQAKAPKQANSQNSKDRKDLQKAENKFLEYLGEADTSNGGAEADIIKFRMSPQVTVDLMTFVEGHGCRMETRTLTAKEQYRLDRRRATVGINSSSLSFDQRIQCAQWTRVFVTRAAQNAYLGRSTALASAEGYLPSSSSPLLVPQQRENDDHEGGEMSTPAILPQIDVAPMTPEAANSPYASLWDVTEELGNALNRAAHALRNLQAMNAAGRSIQATESMCFPGPYAAVAIEPSGWIDECEPAGSTARVEREYIRERDDQYLGCCMVTPVAAPRMHYGRVWLGPVLQYGRAPAGRPGCARNALRVIG